LEITMKKLLGLIMSGGLLLGHGSASEAQMTVQLGRGGTPRVMLGQPSYGQYANPYGQPNYAQPGYYQPNYAQPGYYQPNYAQPGYSRSYYGQPSGPTYYSSGYAAPGSMYSPSYVAPSYAPSYGPTNSYYGNGYSPYTQPSYGTGTGLIINGRSYMIPR
jgi:hypothetical protein